MRTTWNWCGYSGIGLIGVLSLLGCDNKEPDLGIKNTKSIYDLKQDSKSDKSEEELDEARRKAGFDTRTKEQKIEEAKAKYDAMERGYVKGRAERYRKLLARVRENLDKLEKAAPKWAKAKDPAKAVAAFAEKYDEEVKAFREEYDDLSEEGSRGGNVQIDLEALVSGWQALVKAAGPELAEDEQFQASLQALREQADAIEKLIGEIEADDSIEAEEVAEDEGDEKKAG